MRKLPYLLLLLSLMLLAAAASAHAALPLPVGPRALTAPAAEEDGEGEAEAGESEPAEEGESEACSAEELCEAEGDETEEAEECLVEDAGASVLVIPGKSQVRLTIHYHSFEPTTVAIDARLRGGKGGLHLGSERARFRRSGTFHDNFSLGHKQMAKALAAHEFEVGLRPLGSPADCALELATRGSRRAR